MRSRPSLSSGPKTLNPPGFQYGRYRVWGSLRDSRYFRVEGQPAIEPVIRRLSVKAEAKVLGRAFQGHAAVRTLTVADHLLLTAVARDLPLETRARILPEDRLEATCLVGDSAAVEELVRRERAGIAEERATYLAHQAPTRDRSLVRDLQDLYGGRCQICLWDPRSKYGEPACHVHHIQWLSRGGSDNLENVVLICPNHHAVIHRTDAPFDYADYSFVFRAHREALVLDRHLRHAHSQWRETPDQILSPGGPPA